jgi:hypothetical protein
MSIIIGSSTNGYFTVGGENISRTSVRKIKTTGNNLVVIDILGNIILNTPYTNLLNGDAANAPFASLAAALAFAQANFFPILSPALSPTVALPTYRAASFLIAVNIGTTDFYQMMGSPTLPVKIKRIAVSGVGGSAGFITINLFKRTAVNTGGTTIVVPIAQHDSANPAATASVFQYNTNPAALGTGIAVGAQVMNFTTSSVTPTLVWDFSTRNDAPLVLRGVTQSLCINANSTGIALSLDVEIEWEEGV